MTFAVTLAPASGRTVTVDYATADVTAAAGVDYTPVGGRLRFTAGTTERTIAVAILDDRVDEDTETFTVTLSDAQYAVPAAATATGMIADDDERERGVRVEPTALTWYVGGAAASYTVVLTSEPTAEVTVAVAPGTGATVDATELTFTASSWAGERTVTVTTIGSKSAPRITACALPSASCSEYEYRPSG